MEEWQSKWNPFNSNKALVHVNEWKQIIENNYIPPPKFISIDPSYYCPYKCFGCNCQEGNSSLKKHMSLDFLNLLSDFLKYWGVKAVCIAGGNEPLANINVNEFILQNCKNKIEQLLISNGYYLHKFNNIFYLNHLGISVNAGTDSIYSSMTQMPEGTFKKVIDNIEDVNKNSLKKETGLEVTYKYLITPINYMDIYESIKIAKNIGCEQFQARPIGNPWFDLKGNYATFTQDMVDTVKEQVDKARIDFEDETFRIYGVLHKFNPDFTVKNNFKKCYATYTTCYINSEGEVGLCCDLRNNKNLILCRVDNPYEILRYWGTEKHKEIVNNIDISKCPRCTLIGVQEIFENVIIEDKLRVNLF